MRTAHREYIISRVVNTVSRGLTFLTVLNILTSCEQFVQIDTPKTQIVSTLVYSNDATASAAIKGIYSEMISSFGFASGSISSVTFLAGLSADEFDNYSGDPGRISFYENSLLPDNYDITNSLWGEAYRFIYYSNAVIEGLSASHGVSLTTEMQLQGEAKFIRAFCYFYLVNLFGDVPIITSTDYKQNAVSYRNTVEQVYQQIITDLTEAQGLLADDYSFSLDERVRPNKWAATALLARAYLYINDWTNAELQATAVINHTALYNLTDLESVFLKNSEEAIWQLLPVISSQNTSEGVNFILDGAPSIVTLSSSTLASFEEGDARVEKWIGNITVDGETYSFPFKYKIKTATEISEYSMVLRLAEQYLIRAEARAQLDNVNGAREDLNAIRLRAGLNDTPANDQLPLLQAIEDERRRELFSEWGHRWLDLKRTNRADAVLSSLKEGNWQSTDALYPIPQPERLNNVNLSQNSGY